MAVIDPVMGDNGEAYSTYTEEMCRQMIRLVRYADVVVPNVTEACILTGTPYKERWTTRELAKMAEQIVQTGPEKSCDYRNSTEDVCIQLVFRKR